MLVNTRQQLLQWLENMSLAREFLINMVVTLQLLCNKSCF